MYILISLLSIEISNFVNVITTEEGLDPWAKKQVDSEETFEMRPDCPLQVRLVIVSY